MRYLEWSHDPDPDGTEYWVEYVILVREKDGSVRCVHDRHRHGVFPEATWLRLLEEAGFRATAVTGPDEDGILRTSFVARRPR